MRALLYLIYFFYSLAIHAQSQSGPVLIIQSGTNQLLQATGIAGYSCSLGGGYNFNKQGQALGFYVEGGWKYDHFHRAVADDRPINALYTRHYWYRLELQQLYLQIGVDLRLNTKLSLRMSLGQGFLLNGKFQHLYLVKLRRSNPELEEASIIASGAINQTESTNNYHQRVIHQRPDLFLAGNLLYQLEPRLAVGLGISASVSPIQLRHSDANCFSSGCELYSPVYGGQPSASITRLQLALEYAF